MTMRTLVVTADWYSFAVWRGDVCIDHGRRRPVVLASLTTRDLDYALAYGRRRWPQLAIAALTGAEPTT